MKRPKSLKVHVCDDLAARVRAAALRRDLSLSLSEWIRSLLMRACDGDDLVSRVDTKVERMARHSVFIMVGVDALLAGHPDNRLRERAHQAYARKCNEQGLVAATGEGGLPMKRNLVNFTRGSQLECTIKRVKPFQMGT
jgi:hypothetical protein